MLEWARVYTDVDDIFGEDTCNRSGNKLISFLNELELVIRPSVDGLYRDGTVHISRDMHKQCFITRRETTSGAPNPHRHRSRAFL